MIVVREIPQAEIPQDFTDTNHFHERVTRYEAYAPFLTSRFYKAFIVDRGHIGGQEIHVINRQAVVTIYNKTTGKIITVEALRPAQLRRYHEQTNTPMDWTVHHNAARNTKNDMNHK